MRYDVVIENGRVIDPESNTDANLNIGLKNGKIEALSQERLVGQAVIDATGCIVAPGFIDIHAHEDFVLDEARGCTLPTETGLALLRGGVTTMVGGNCGIGAYPFKPYLEQFTSSAFPINYYSLIGYSSLRDFLGIDRYRYPTPEEICRLAEMVREGMELGMPGVSFGLQYTPGTTQDEMLAVADIVKEYDGFIAVHLRYDYPLMALETVREIIKVVKLTGVRMQISHLAANIYGGNNLRQVLALFQEMHTQGYDIKGDMYPYDAWLTGIKSAVFDNEPFEKYAFTPYDMEIITGPLAGQRCNAQLFKQLRSQKEDIFVACHNANPWCDIVEALSHPLVFLGSDGMLVKDRETGEFKGHPRCAGSAARFIRLFVREQGVLDLTTALRKMTLDPANRLNLPDKGRIQPGKDGDITIFSLEQITEQGGFGLNISAAPPLGIEYVLISGRVVYTAADGRNFQRTLSYAKTVHN